MASPTAAPARPSDGRTLVQVLFSRKREVEGYPHLLGGQSIAFPARRNSSGHATISAMLAKAVVVALKGDVVEIQARDRAVCVTSRSQTTGRLHRTLLDGPRHYLPLGHPTYHLGLLYLAEALARPAEASDLLSTWEEMLECYEGQGRVLDAGLANVIAQASDELYFWACYEARPSDGSCGRLREGAYELHPSEEAPLVARLDPIDHAVLVDLDRLRALRRGTPPAPEPAPTVVPGARFRGWQLSELVESLDLGMHCLLVGPTATGKSLCALEAFARVRRSRAVHVIEGAESLREFDLLGVYVPEGEGRFTWRDGVLTKAMRDGAFLFVDEFNRLNPRTANVLLGALSRSAVVLTEHGSEEVQAASGFQVVAALNLGKGYVVNALDQALLNRFEVVLEFRYLPPSEEEVWLVAETGLPAEIARAMVRVAGEVRAKKRAHELSADLTPRGLLAWARKCLARRGGSLLDRLQAAAKVTWLPAVAGSDSDGYIREDVSDSLLAIVEAHTPAAE